MMAEGKPQDLGDNGPVGVQSTITEAVVQFGEVDPDDELARFTDLDDSAWEDWFCINRYEDDLRVYMAGVTSPGGFSGDQAAFFQLAAPTRLLVADWTAERTGTPPKMPDPEPTDDNLVLMDKHHEPVTKIMLPGGTDSDIRYRISGTFVYGFKNPDASQYCWPTPPWLEPGTGECDVSPGLYMQGLVCCESGGGDGGGGSQNQPTNPSQVGEFPQD